MDHMAQPLISIVVPAYNAADYLAECLASIERQSYGRFEVTVVDDGSTDATPLIAAETAARDPRFKVVSIPNGGVSHARNHGTALSKGELLTFVDADDLLHPEALKTMKETLERRGADVCITRFRKFRGEGRGRKLAARRLPRHIQTEEYDYEGAMRTALYQKRLLNSPWGSLMKRGLIGEGGAFREGTRYEDLDAFYRMYGKARKIVYIDWGLYLYRDHPGSFMNTWSPGRLDVLDVTDRLLEHMRNHHPRLENAALDRRFSAHCNMLLLMRGNRAEDPEAMERCWRVIREGRRRALADRNVRLKNKLGALLSYVVLREIKK